MDASSVEGRGLILSPDAVFLTRLQRKHRDKQRREADPGLT